MKLKTMLYGLTLMLGCFVLAACVNDEEGPCLSDAQTKAVFSLVLQDNAQTRAAWSENSGAVSESEGIDNYIDLSTLKMYVFKADANNTYVGPLTDIMYIAQSKESDPYETDRYECIGTLPETVVKGSYRFVIVANCEDTDLPSPSQITWEGLKNIPFEKSGTSVGKIPMWGFLNADIELNPGQKLPLGELPLLRAMAKVTVNLADVDANKDFTLKSITLNKYNKEGYVGPTEALPDGVTKPATNTAKLDQEKCINVPQQTASESLQLTVKDNTVEFYVPEYDNSSKDAYITVVVTYTDPETKQETDFTYEKGIEFKNYTDVGVGTDEYYNIVRNHHYQFNIIKVTIDGPLYIIPKVNPWEDGPTLEYGISASTNIRLFDSWLYRYDTDKYTPEATEENPNPVELPDYRNWNDSYMVVSTGSGEGITDVEPAGRPLRSPMIQLVTTGAPNGTFDLVVDNENFEIIYVTKDDEAGKVTAYTSKGQTLRINTAAADAKKKEVYTYFYIVPTSSASSGSTAKVFLYYNDPVVGTQEMPYNYSALPGYSDDSSEFWVYSVTTTEYDNGQIDDNKFMRMYYQDANNPLVPVN